MCERIPKFLHLCHQKLKNWIKCFPVKIQSNQGENLDTTPASHVTLAQHTSLQTCFHQWAPGIKCPTSSPAAVQHHFPPLSLPLLLPLPFSSTAKQTWNTMSFLPVLFTVPFTGSTRLSSPVDPFIALPIEDAEPFLASSQGQPCSLFLEGHEQREHCHDHKRRLGLVSSTKWHWHAQISMTDNWNLMAWPLIFTIIQHALSLW